MICPCCGRPVPMEQRWLAESDPWVSGMLFERSAVCAFLRRLGAYALVALIRAGEHMKSSVYRERPTGESDA